MARSRSAASKAGTSHAPREVSRRLSFLLLFLVVVAGCSSAADRGGPSSLRAHPKGSSAPSTSRPADARKTVTTTTAGAVSVGERRDAAVMRAWAESKDGFYRAALLADPGYGPFLSTLVTGGPVYVHSVAYLSGLQSAGVIGPSRWRVGNARVVKQSSGRAEVEGCLWDTGSVWRASGRPAPPSLGGGAGLTASNALLVLERGRWLVLEDAVSAVTSPKEQGPCHGF